MRHRSGWVAVALFLAIGAAVVLVLRQSAEFDDDHGPAHATTQIVLHVRYQSGQPARVDSADLLWSVCAVDIPGERVAKTVRAGTITAELRPALGDDVQARFVGCLQDLTLHGMLGQVMSTRVVPDRARHPGPRRPDAPSHGTALGPGGTGGTGPGGTGAGGGG